MDAPEVDLHGDAKSFFTATFPYDHPLMPPDPTGQGVVDLRLKGTARWGPLRAEVHQTATGLSEAPLAGFGSTGVGLQAPEAVDLSWQATDGPLTLRGRVDRLWLRAATPGVAVTAGRQAVSFGTGLFFTPLDLVNPFTPAVVDPEYKPGVDALRVDLFPSATSRVTVVGAYAGGWEVGGTVLTAYGQGTIGATDLGGFVGAVHGDLVSGVTAAGSAGPVALHADAALTVPTAASPTRPDPSVRAVAGGLWRPAARTTLSAEGYVQTLTWTTPPFALAADPRFLRGELWLHGPAYLGVGVQQELSPLVNASLNAIVGLDPDGPSALLAPAISWSIADDAVWSLSAFHGLGQRPGPLAGTSPLDLAAVDLRSEFGTYPSAVFTRFAAYF
jgi:hypothetical protein